jgi:hypothetical protein
MKIIVEIDLPDKSLCRYTYGGTGNCPQIDHAGSYVICRMFGVVLECDVHGKTERCKQCYDAEVTNEK